MFIRNINNSSNNVFSFSLSLSLSTNMIFLPMKKQKSIKGFVMLVTFRTQHVWTPFESGLFPSLVIRCWYVVAAAWFAWLPRISGLGRNRGRQGWTRGAKWKLQRSIELLCMGKWREPVLLVFVAHAYCRRQSGELLAKFNWPEVRQIMTEVGNLMASLRSRVLID